MTTVTLSEMVNKVNADKVYNRIAMLWGAAKSALSGEHVALIQLHTGGLQFTRTLPEDTTFTVVPQEGNYRVITTVEENELGLYVQVEIECQTLLLKAVVKGFIARGIDISTTVYVELPTPFTMNTAEKVKHYSHLIETVSSVMARLETALRLETATVADLLEAKLNKQREQKAALNNKLKALFVEYGIESSIEKAILRTAALNSLVVGETPVQENNMAAFRKFMKLGIIEASGYFTPEVLAKLS